LSITNIVGDPITTWDTFIGLIPGSVGETSTLCILIGAAILLFTGMASWRIMLSVFAGGLFMGFVANYFGTPTYPASALTPIDQICLGGFAFAAVFMATDPVTGARTNIGKYIYGFLIGVVAILIRVYNNGYPEGAMLAVLLMNAFAPLIDYCVVEFNIRRRQNRLKVQ
ncbi:MAG: RnfABCDGE type electron transport complex subunit D, partial [Muribaculaceae bacterium]